jgi:hypothetical protein
MSAWQLALANHFPGFLNPCQSQSLFSIWFLDGDILTLRRLEVSGSGPAVALVTTCLIVSGPPPNLSTDPYAAFNAALKSFGCYLDDKLLRRFAQGLGRVQHIFDQFLFPRHFLTAVPWW